MVQLTKGTGVQPRTLTSSENYFEIPVSLLPGLFCWHIWRKYSEQKDFLWIQGGVSALCRTAGWRCPAWWVFQVHQWRAQDYSSRLLKQSSYSHWLFILTCETVNDLYLFHIIKLFVLRIWMWLVVPLCLHNPESCRTLWRIHPKKVRWEPLTLAS